MAAHALTRTPRVRADEQAPRTSMGLSTACYSIRWRDSTSDGSLARFTNGLDFLRHADQLGAAGVQTVIDDWDEDLQRRLREFAEERNLYIEGQVALPFDETDLEQFERRLAAGRGAGATIIRTVCLSGRRYESFKTLESFRAFAARSRLALERAEPVARGLGVKLALENHKDWRVDELLDLIGRLDSGHVGICLDTGNSIALLEDPLTVVEAYAPRSITTHFKDMAAREDEHGFLLSEVPLGQGYLDLGKFVEVCRRANPAIRFVLEMITRDPLRIPCLEEEYWATFPEVAARELAQGLREVRTRASAKELPTVAGLTRDERLRYEEANVVACLDYARERLLTHA
jgi:sugar phosphate isomerase/epimerase